MEHIVKANMRSPARLPAHGIAKTYRSSVPFDSTAVWSVPADVYWVLLRNAGTTQLRISFDAAGPDFFTIPAGEMLPCPIRVRPGQAVRMRSVTTLGTIEALAWCD